MSKLINYESKKILYKNSVKLDVSCNFHHVTMKDFTIFKELLDLNLIQIAEGESEYILSAIKSNMISFFSGKTERQRRGAVAELLTHVFLREIGFTQECIFNNLEEGSLKKGFDGLYLNNKLFWLVESKSSYTKGILHEDRIRNAISDLSDKIEGRTTNNPFRNAVHHIKSVRDNYNLSLLKVIHKLSKDYSEGIYYSISDFNIIPVSTLYDFNKQSIDDISTDILNLLNGQDYNDILVICIDNDVYQDFMLYLEE